MTVSEKLESRREEIFRIAARRGRRRDLLVDVEPGRSLLDLGGLLVELQELLGCRVDVVTERGLRERIRERVLSEARPL